MPNKENKPGVAAKYKLNGNDQTKAMSISKLLDRIAATITKQAGRKSIKNVMIIVPISTGEYGLKKIKSINSEILIKPAIIPKKLEILFILIPPYISLTL